MTAHPALELTQAVADLLADPETAPTGWRGAADRQHLAYGVPGIALLHIERAAAGLGPWQRAHDWLAAGTREPLTSGADSHPFYGAPAFAYVLACAAEHQPGSYQRALATLDAQVAKDVRRRLDAAHRRIDTGHLPALAEFDVIRGLAGYGAHLLHHTPASPLLRGVLEYCVRLTEPITDRGGLLPGWWTASGPSGRPDERYPGGHANNGVAHGIGGVLAFLALAARKGILVNGHREAIRTLLAWLDRWQQDQGRVPLWPYWVTRAELRSGRLSSGGPRRPSWCYGTAGLARAQQLAAIVLEDADRQAEAESAIAIALTDPAQLRATTDRGLCHGFAGLAHIAARTADDARPESAALLRATLPSLLSAVCPPGADPAETAAAIARDKAAGPGFLNGAAGTALALVSPATTTPPRSAWGVCLLLA
ncbi:lanthionine synthetase C family protein [Streptomyces sp. YIM 98790]|uniref:lanthionine synthetase C family protein n=1 Tax=Streptomyces sp. YIM 98790 TaxID=2689077 RepID=UPI001409C708|nr:lanthionine synthetase C family protein [Streptomyces sp. YIM 98790]